jgi:predicted component of type VI protein secretion system
MKLNLVVAQGVHQGKTIPITVAEFRIGRDPDCQLRPASPSISKKHCSIIIREERVFLKDFGSTNGTFVNNEQVAGECELKDGDYLKAGPLDFTVKIEASASSPHLRAIPSAPAAAPATAPAPAPAPAVAKAPAKPAAKPAADSDDMAALLLADGDDDAPAASVGTVEQTIPDGTTIMEMPAIPGGDPKKEDDKKKGFNADTSAAAAAILSKYLRRPRT